MELIQVGPHTYYLKNATNIGIYKIDEESVYLIDTGNDSDAGKKVLKILNENNFQVKGIINTHSHADHIGGNKVIANRTNALILSSGIEKSFIKNPILEPLSLYGANPFKKLKTKFLMAEPSNALDIADYLPSGLEYFSLKGHSPDMIGLKTSDDIYFLGDALFSPETITKYHIFYLYNVRDFLSTLNFLKTLKGKLYIPSHVPATSDISNLITLNEKKVMEICTLILDILEEKKTFEELLSLIFNHYNLTINESEYVLIGSTIKAYLTYLLEEEKINYTFLDNKMYWQRKVTDYS